MSGGAADLAVAGLGTGAVAALSGLGVLATYRVTGVLNVAFGAIGMFGAYLVRALVRDAQLPAWAAGIIVVCCFAPVLGLCLEAYVFGPLQARAADAGRLLTAGFGVTVLLVGIATAVWGQAARTDAPALLPGGTMRIGGLDIPSAVPIELALVLAVALGLAWFSRGGPTIRAVIDDRRLAELAGLPARRLARVGWVAGTMLATLTGVLLAPQLRFDPPTLTLVIFETLGVAIAARLRSASLAIVFALGTAIVQAELTGVHLTGAAGSVLDAVRSNLFVVLLLLATWLTPAFSASAVSARAFSARTFSAPATAGVTAATFPAPTFSAPAKVGTVTATFSASATAGVTAATFSAPAKVGTVTAATPQHRPPRRAIPLTIPLTVPRAPFLLLLTLGVFCWNLRAVDLRTALTIPALALVLLSFRVLHSAGLLSLGQAGLAGIGALTAGWASGWGILAAPAAGAIVAVMLALPVLRQAGLHLAVATLAAATALSSFLFNQPLFAPSAVARPAFAQSDRPYLYVELCLVAVALLCLTALVHGRVALRLSALRDSEIAARTAGIAVDLERLAIFAAAGAVAALGGALWAAGDQVFDATAFEPAQGLIWFAAAAAVGFADSTALIAAAIVIVVADSYVAGASAILVGAATLLLPALRQPSLVRRTRRTRRTRRSRRTEVPSHAPHRPLL